MKYRELADQACSIARPAALLGDSWTLMVLRDVFLGVRRFDQFQSRLGVSRAILADRLSRLVAAGVLARHPYADEYRTRYEYRLTPTGLDLYPVMLALRTFADKHMSPEGPLVVSHHKDCSGVAEVAVRCSVCAQELGARDVVVEPGAGARNSAQLK